MAEGVHADFGTALVIPTAVWETVEALHGRRWPPQSEAEADAFIIAAGAESLLPLLYEEPSLPAPVAAALPRHRAMLRVYEQRSKLLQNAAKEVCGWMRDEPFLFYKGIDYAYRLYAKPSLRPMRDLDVLVPPERIDAVGAILVAQGFERVFPGGAVTRLASHHERSYVGRGYAIDLHHSFIQRPRHRIDYEEVWRERERFAIDGVEAWRLAPHHALVVHALAMAIDEFAVPVLRYLDLRLMFDAVPAAIDVAKRWQCVRALYGALRQSARVFPDLDVEGLVASLLPASTRHHLDQNVLPDVHSVPPPLTRARQLRVKFHLLDSATRRAMFAAYHAYALIAGRLAARQRGASST